LYKQRTFDRGTTLFPNNVWQLKSLTQNYGSSFSKDQLQSTFLKSRILPFINRKSLGCRILSTTLHRSLCDLL